MKNEKITLKLETLEWGEARADELPLLAEMIARLFQGEKDFVSDPSVQLRGLQLIDQHPENGRIFVARQGSSVVGMVNLQFTISTAMGARVGLLEDVIVTESLRGQGIGSWMFDKLMTWCRDEGLPRLTLLTEGTNLKAQEFYRRKGFTSSSMVPMRFFS